MGYYVKVEGNVTIYVGDINPMERKKNSIKIKEE